MDILKIFKRKDNKPTILQVGATLYPDKIIIETTDRVKEGFGISSTSISILAVGTDAGTLGQKIRHHLGLTRIGLPISKDYKQAYNEFLNKAGFKNGKEHHKDALHLLIHQKENQITITSTRNGGYTGKSRGFLGMRDVDPIKLTDDVDNFTLGINIKKGWSNCL